VICLDCRQPEGVVQRIGNDGLCESCRLVRAREACASKRLCASCGAPEETADGLIDLDDNGLCEVCQEWAPIFIEEGRCSMDFAYSMNY
jgi:hypothetical protein